MLGSAPGPPRPPSSRSGTSGRVQHAPVSLIEEAMAMCKSARSNQFASEQQSEASPRHPVDRPHAPTPEATNHWLQDMDQAASTTSEKRLEVAGAAVEQKSPTAVACESPSPDPADEILRPRSPTPTKMLAWEEENDDADAVEEDRDNEEDRGDQTDGLISRLIVACQRDDVEKAFVVYGKLCRMGVSLYEGVYKMIIDCCLRTQRLGHAMQFYETLRSSGQRISVRLVTLLIEACAREQHGDKVHAIWTDWCPAAQAISTEQTEVLLVVVSALVRTMSPDLARDVLADAIRRSDGELLSRLPNNVGELEDLLHLNETVAEEARMNGMLIEELAGHFSELSLLLQELRQRCPTQGDGGQAQAGIQPCELLARMDSGELFMEDLDLDLELAAQ